MKLFLIFIFLLSNTFLINSWGPIGHNLTARIGYELLNLDTKNLLNLYQNIKSVDDFESLANWADNVKFTQEYAWSYNLHFCDIYAIPLSRCTIDYKLDCVDERCIISAINNFTTSLIKDNTNKDSLSFLIHFLGDIWQPFHVGYLEDLGANKIKVKFDSHLTNLHAVWDDYIINKRVKELNSIIYFTNELKQKLNIINRTYPLDPLVFAQISLDTICNFNLYYDNGVLITNDHYLSNKYYKENLDIIQNRIAYSSYYLSRIITYIYNSNNIYKISI